MPETFPIGRFVWHELMTTDPEAAIEFYTKVIGWRVTRFDQDPSYRMWTMGGPPMGGLMLLPEDARRMGAPPHWLPYLLVPDVGIVTRQAMALGARTYVEPRDIPSVGRFAVLADPQGAVFAVYTPAGEERGSDETPLGDFSWHELATTDYQAAWRFYQSLFEWVHTESMDMGPAGVYWMFARSGTRRTIGGMYTKSPEMAAPPHWLCYVRVASADKAAQMVARLGGKVLNGPMDVPGGDRIAQCMDPQGAVFAVHSVAPAMVTEEAAALREAKPAAKPKKAKPKKARLMKAKAKKARKVKPKKVKAAAKPRKAKVRKPKVRKAKAAAKPKKAKGAAKAKRVAKRRPAAARPKSAKPARARAKKTGARKARPRATRRTARRRGKARRR